MQANLANQIKPQPTENHHLGRSIRKLCQIKSYFKTNTVYLPSNGKKEMKLM
uniref:Uncharacterized protein n=1 Tax=Rhizophagus irregularis (strain DAOM 181602 / DAOM 197198 / MUCL 43194) TaxID=747089 RepID=U9SQ07_RHIID